MRNHYVTEAEEELSSLEEEGFFDTAKDFFFGTRITDLTAEADKSKRKKQRDPKSVYALVLHQMACCFKRKDPLKSYLRTNSHFVILPDGKILQLHPISAYLWASHGFNKGSIAVEFAGNFPSTRGKWWKGDKFGQNQVTPEQIEAGRYLVRHLIRTMGLTHILAHRQSSAMRENDPGPDIWYHVGQWAIDNHGLKDGGPGFKVGDGNPIPDLWRTWGKAKPQPELEEEIDPESPMHERWLQEALNHILALRLRADDAGGPAVRSALRSFQRRHGLPADGELSEEVEQLLVSAGASPHNHPPSRETRKADREDLKLPATTTPTPGRFYDIQYAQGGLLKTAERAYGSVAERQKWAQIINNHPLNRKVWREPNNDYERKVFSNGVISFGQVFTCGSEQRIARSGEKKCFARIYIPEHYSFDDDVVIGDKPKPQPQNVTTRFKEWLPRIIDELERRPARQRPVRAICWLKMLLRKRVDDRYIRSQEAQKHQADDASIKITYYVRLGSAVDSVIRHRKTLPLIVEGVLELDKEVHKGIARIENLDALRNRTGTGDVTYPGIRKMYLFVRTLMDDSESIYSCFPKL
jgi:hypothetical protein